MRSFKIRLSHFLATNALIVWFNIRALVAI
mgnify:CR=1 FL=1